MPLRVHAYFTHMSMLLPGDSLSGEVAGPGVREGPGGLVATAAGEPHTARLKGKTVAYVAAAGKRYLPRQNDHVVGVVTGVFGDSYKVQLCPYSPELVLDAMAFENATKKNRPQLKAGSVVYARVKSAHPDVEGELECLDSATGKAAGFGVLATGCVVDRLGLHYCRALWEGKHEGVLEALAKRCRFEVAVGVNGSVWIDAEGDVQRTMACVRVLREAEHVDPSQLDALVDAAMK